MNTVVTKPSLSPSTGTAAQLGFGVGLIACVVFANGIFGRFLFDDLHLVANPKMHELWPWGEIAQPTRPLASWTLQLNAVLGGMKAWHFHLVNIAIHAAAGCVLFGLVRRTLELPGIAARLRNHATSFAFLAAVLWTVHPLQTQSVTYISQRYEALMGLFYLGTLYCLVRGFQSSRSTAWYLGAVASAWAGAGSKEVIATVPLVALLYDVAFLSSTWRSALRSRGWVYLLLLTPVAWIVWSLKRAMVEAGPTVGFGMKSVSMWEYLRTQPSVLLHYLKTAFWPDTLILDHGWPIANDPWQIYGLGAVIVMLVGVSLWAMWKHPKLGFLGLAIFLILAPTSSIVPVKDLAFEHRMYLSLAPLIMLTMLAVESALFRLITRETVRGTLIATLALVSILGLSLRTIARNRDYARPVTIWSQCIENNPHHPRPYRILADIYLDDDPQKALHYYRKALELVTEKHWVLVDIGNIYLSYYAEAARLRPDDVAVQINASRTHANLGNYAAAVAHARRAVEASPGDRDATMQLAWLLSTSEEEAVRNGAEAVRLVEALPIRQNFIDVQRLEALSAAYAEAGDFEKAVQVAEQCVAEAQRMRSRRVVELDNRLHLFRQHKPFRTTPKPSSPLRDSQRPLADRT
jgi:protein O-mannosyl-transferase